MNKKIESLFCLFSKYKPINHKIIKMFFIHYPPDVEKRNTSHGIQIIEKDKSIYPQTPLLGLSFRAFKNL